MKFIKEGFILVLLFTLVTLSTVYEGLPDLLPANTLLFVAMIAALIAVFNGLLALREYNKFEGSRSFTNTIKNRHDVWTGIYFFVGDELYPLTHRRALKMIHYGKHPSSHTSTPHLL